MQQRSNERQGDNCLEQSSPSTIASHRGRVDATNAVLKDVTQDPAAKARLEEYLSDALSRLSLEEYERPSHHNLGRKKTGRNSFERPQTPEDLSDFDPGLEEADAAYRLRVGYGAKRVVSLEDRGYHKKVCTLENRLRCLEVS